MLTHPDAALHFSCLRAFRKAMLVETADEHIVEIGPEPHQGEFKKTRHRGRQDEYALSVLPDVEKKSLGKRARRGCPPARRSSMRHAEAALPASKGRIGSNETSSASFSVKSMHAYLIALNFFLPVLFTLSSCQGNIN